MFPWLFTLCMRVQVPGLDAIAASAAYLLLGRGLHTSPTPTAATRALHTPPGERPLRGAASAAADNDGASASGSAAATPAADRWVLTPQGANPASAAADAAAGAATFAGARRDAAALTRLLGSLSQLHALPPFLHAAGCSHLASSACLLAPAEAAVLARVLGTTRRPVPDTVLRAVWTAAAPGLRRLDGKELTALAWGLLAASRGGDSVGRGEDSVSPAAWGLGKVAAAAQAGSGSDWWLDTGSGAEWQLQGCGQRRGLPREKVLPAHDEAEGQDSQPPVQPPGQLPAVLMEALGAIAGRFLGGAVLPGARGTDGQTGGRLGLGQEGRGDKQEVRGTLRAVGERNGALGAGTGVVDDEVEAAAGMTSPVGAGAGAGAGPGAGPGAGAGAGWMSRTAAGAGAGTEIGAGANLRGLTPANLARLATAMAPAAAIAAQHAQQQQAAAATAAAANKAGKAGKAGVKRRRGQDNPAAASTGAAFPDAGINSDAPAPVETPDSSAPTALPSPERASPQFQSASPHSLSASQACLDLLERVGRLSYQRVSAFKGRHLAEAAEAFATARVPYDGLFMALAHRARQLADAGEGQG